MNTLPSVGQYGVTPGGGAQMAAVRMWTGRAKWRPPFWEPAWAGHAAMVREVRPEHDRPVVLIEAAPGGVKRRELTWGDLNDWRFSEFRLDPHMLDTVPYLDALVGTPYDWPSVVEVGVRVRMAKFRGRAADHPDRRLFCSELCAWWFRDRYGFDLFPGVAPGTVSPDALDRRRSGPLALQPGPNA